MPKHEFMTPKAIANRIKAKGLLKLRWYCQMCEKSCRDENGFKCHCASESHLRQMQLYREDPDKFMTEYSRQFEIGFMQILKVKGRSRVRANAVYQQYIQDRNHIHMKATKWESLASFIQYLGKEGKVVADQTPKGWFIEYIDRDPEVLARQEADQRRERMHLDEVQRNERLIARQRQELSHNVIEQTNDQNFQLKRVNDDDKVVLNMKALTNVSSSACAADTTGLTANNVFTAASKNSQSSQNSLSSSSSCSKRKRVSAVEQIMMNSSYRGAPSKTPRVIHTPSPCVSRGWVKKALIVKILNRKLQEGALYKKKGEVIEVIDGTIARVRMCGNSQLTLRIDESELETVIPALNRKVLIVKGNYSGQYGTLLSIDKTEFCGCIELEDKQTVNVDFEHFCKTILS